MPYARPNLTRPAPRPSRPGPVRHIATPDTGPARGTTLPAQLAPWNYTGRVYISFDPPTATSPTWLEVTEFVDLVESTLSITRGRQDGMSDVNVGTCKLVVDNTDGRWTPSNPTGAWYGLIRKGIWLRADVLPPSGTVSTRFVGFVTALPTAWAGLYASTTITASDRFVQLGQAPMLPAMTSAEVVFDTSTGPLVAAHYPLNENAAGDGFALAFGDITGNVSPPLHPVPFGSNQATYLNFIQAQGSSAPGFDGNQCVKFQPSAISVGTVLQTTLSPWNTYNGFFSFGALELWVQTTFENTSQAFAALFDPGSGCAAVFYIDGATGYLAIQTGSVTSSGAYAALNQVGPLTPTSTQAGVVLNDGNWHYVSIATAVGPTPINPLFVVNIDGKTAYIGEPPNNVSPNMNTLIIGGSPAAGSSYNCFTGAIANVSWILTGNAASNYPAHFQAGYLGFSGETVDQRVARVARYAQIPEPTSLQVPAPGFNPVPVYTGGKGPWTNLATCIHQAGTQSIIGRQPLDVMREAARTEGMPLYISRDGYLTIQPCTTRYGASAAWSVNAADLDPTTAFSDDFQYLCNQITVSTNGGATQTMNGAAGYASQAEYGVYNQSIQSASVNPTEAQNLALGAIGSNANPVPRIAPLVVEVATLATQTGVISPNPSFTGAFAPWQAFGGSGALSAAFTYQGAPTSGLLTPDGVSGQGFLQSGGSTPVVAGQSYSCPALVYSPTGSANVATAINWYNASGYMTTTSGTAVAVPAGVWTSLPTTSGIPPTGATYAEAVVVQGGTPPATTLLYVAFAGIVDPTSAYGAAWYDAVLASDISTLVTVTNLPEQAPAAAMSVFVEGYTETLGMGQHTFSFSTSPQTYANAIQLDSPTLGLLDDPNLVLAY